MDLIFQGKQYSKFHEKKLNFCKKDQNDEKYLILQKYITKDSVLCLESSSKNEIINDIWNYLLKNDYLKPNCLQKFSHYEIGNGIIFIRIYIIPYKSLYVWWFFWKSQFFEKNACWNTLSYKNKKRRGQGFTNIMQYIFSVGELSR